jgi:PBSX family phage terminase large subunit
MKISSKYKPLWGEEYRVAILSGGRGSGKSFAAQTFLRDLSYQAGHKIANTRYTMASARKSIIPEFSEKLEMSSSPFGDWLMYDDFELVDNTYLNKQSQSEMFFIGLKTSSGIQTASLKSINGLTTFLLEESEELPDDGTEMHESTYDKISNSVRTKGKDLRDILLWNPTSIDAFVYKRFFQDAGVDITFNGIKDDVLYIYTTYLDNIDNLHPSFIEKAERVKAANPARYDHIYLGLPTSQNENALWKMDTMISPYRVLSLPEIRRVVVAVDPSVSEGEAKNDECGIVVVAEGFDNHFYVLKDASDHLSPLEWAKTIVGCYNEYQADKIVAEVNQGHKLVELTIKTILPNAPVDSVVAKKGKMTRAEPVSSLYEDGRVHHVGNFKDLEYQMCNFTGDPKQKSPDRLDALVYGLTELAFPKGKPLFFA